MIGARSALAVATLAAVASAQNSTATITSASSSATASSSGASSDNFITTSIMWAADNLPVEAVPGLDIPTDDVTLQGSIVTVGPSGTVIDIACPYTMTGAIGEAVCDIFDGITYTLRPGYEANHFGLSTAISTLGVVATAIANADSECTLKDDSADCKITAAATVMAGGTTTSSTTTSSSSYAGVTYSALTITAGMEKASAIPTPQGTGAAGSLKAGSALAVAALALVAVAL